MKDLKRAEWVRCDRCIYWLSKRSEAAPKAGQCRRFPDTQWTSVNDEALMMAGEFCGEGRFVSSHLGGSDGTVPQIRPIELAPRGDE